MLTNTLLHFTIMSNLLQWSTQGEVGGGVLKGLTTNYKYEQTYS